jgi:hypothetical protein
MPRQKTGQVRLVLLAFLSQMQQPALATSSQLQQSLMILMVSLEIQKWVKFSQQLDFQHF